MVGVLPVLERCSSVLANHQNIVDTAPPPLPSTWSGWSFTQGFLLGQLTIIVFVCIFIKIFIFGEPPSSDAHARAQQQRERRAHSFPSTTTRPAISITNLGGNPTATHSKKISTVIRPSPPLTTATILAKTYYNVNGHQPESVDWFNVLIAQTIAQLRNDAQQDNAILTSLTNVLNGPQMPDFVGGIRVTEINLGEEFPIFSNCRVIPVSAGDGDAGSDPGSSASQGTGGRLQARMDVDLSDTITLGIETKLLLNYPKPLVAVLPVALAVSVIRFSGTLSISFIPSGPPPYSSMPPTPTATRKTSGEPAAASPADPTPPTSLTFSFLPDYRLELSTHSLLGSRSRLQDVPKIAQLVEARLRMWFDERCVEPRFQQVVLPSMWPRKRNTRGGETEADTEDKDGTRTSPRKREKDRERDGDDRLGRVQSTPAAAPTASSSAAATRRPETPTRPPISAAMTRPVTLDRSPSPNATEQRRGPARADQSVQRDRAEQQEPAPTPITRIHDTDIFGRKIATSTPDGNGGASDGFVSGRELEAHLRHNIHTGPRPASRPARPGLGTGASTSTGGEGGSSLRLRDHSTSYRMPGSMPA